MLVAQVILLHTLGRFPRPRFIWNCRMSPEPIGAPMKIYFDPGQGLRCEVLDANGKPPPQVGGGGSGGGAGACWITLPYDSTIRLRANMYGYGKKEGDGLLIQMSPPNIQSWDIQASDTNPYFMSGTFTIATPAEYVARTSMRLGQFGAARWSCRK
jgi:hypothetical protein